MPAPKPDAIKLAKDLGQKSVLLAIARQPNSERLFLGCADFKVLDLDLSQEKPEAREFGSHESYVTGVALADKTLVSGGYDGRLIFWDTESRTKIRSIDNAHAKWIRRVVATTDGKLIASVADDMVCRLWETATGKMLAELRGHQAMTPHHFTSMLYAAAFTPDGKFLATGDKVGHIVIWDVAGAKEAATLEATAMYTWDPVNRRHSIGGIRSLAFSADGAQLAVGGMDQVGNIDHLEGKTRVEVFDWRGGKRTHEFKGDKFNGLVNKVAFGPDNAWLLAAGGANDGHVQFYDLKTSKALRQEKAPVHIHDGVLNEAMDTIYLAGPNKLLVYVLKS